MAGKSHGQGSLAGYIPCGVRVGHDLATEHVHTYTYILYIHIYIHTHIYGAKSLQLCLTLFDPRDYSPPGSSVHGTFQPRILEWAFPSPGDLPDPEIKSAALVSPVSRQLLYH